MSKQQNKVSAILSTMFHDLKEEVVLSKITGHLIHKGIRADIWIESANLLVEIHGQQHFIPSSFGMTEIQSKVKFNRQMDRDSKLVSVCKDFDINYEQVDYNQETTLFSMYKQFSKYLVIENV